MKHRKHPPTKWRLQATSEFLRDYYDDLDLLKEESLLFDDAWKHDLSVRFTSAEQIAVKKKTEEDQYDKIIRTFCHYIAIEIHKLNIPIHSLSKQSLKRCNKRLVNHQPIGSQGKSREELQGLLWKYREEGINDLDQKAKAFKKLLSEFSEQPLDLPTILASGFSLRFEIFEQFYEAYTKGQVNENIDDICSRLDEVDEKLAVSIRTARVHSIVLDRMQKAQ